MWFAIRCAIGTVDGARWTLHARLYSILGGYDQQDSLAGCPQFTVPSSVQDDGPAVSALNNVRREMSFFEITATKYGIQLSPDPPSHITRAYIDMFNSVSTASSSLLEGMVVLWATEHVRLTIVYSYRIHAYTVISVTAQPGCTQPLSHQP